VSAQPPTPTPSGVPAQYPHYPQYPEAFYPPEPESEFHITQWLDVIRRRRWLLFVICALSLAVAAVLYAITPRLFRATAVVQIERRVPSVVGIDEQLLSESWYDAERSTRRNTACCRVAASPSVSCARCGSSTTRCSTRHAPPWPAAR
jgi:hypothetical protein